MDPLNKISKSTDSTYLLAVESIKIGFDAMYCNPNDVSIDSKDLIVEASQLILKNNELKIIKSTKKKVALSKFDVVLIRQDPPFNMDYITNTYLFNIERNKRKPFYINDPEGIRNFSEKIFPLFFKDYIPDTSITASKKVINNFLVKHKKIVVKPLYEKGGNGVFVLENKTRNKNNIISKQTNKFSSPIILQKYLPSIVKGDKRILLINGNPVGAVNRVPLKGSFIANLHLGSHARKTHLTKKEIKICNELKPFLKKNGLFFVGIDVIGGQLTEINVTSPTGIKQINELNKTKIESQFWKEVIKKLFK